MKAIEIVIPTRNRHTKLMRCLASIPKVALDIPISITVVCDGDQPTYEKISENGQVDKALLVKKHRGAVYCRNLAFQNVKDALIYATDDITFMPGAIDEAVKEMRSLFPDDDGVVGFTQVNHEKFSIAGVALVGHKFLLRYPNQWLLFPDYFHFSCQEVAYLGKKLGKIALAEKAKLFHYHPSFLRAEADRTHVEARARRLFDNKLSNERYEKGLIWGDE